MSHTNFWYNEQFLKTTTHISSLWEEKLYAWQTDQSYILSATVSGLSMPNFTKNHVQDEKSVSTRTGKVCIT